MISSFAPFRTPDTVSHSERKVADAAGCCSGVLTSGDSASSFVDSEMDAGERGDSRGWRSLVDAFHSDLRISPCRKLWRSMGLSSSRIVGWSVAAQQQRRTSHVRQQHSTSAVVAIATTNRFRFGQQVVCHLKHSSSSCSMEHDPEPSDSVPPKSTGGMREREDKERGCSRRRSLSLTSLRPRPKQD